MNGSKRLKANREDVKSLNLSIVRQYFSFLKYSALKYPYEFIFIKLNLPWFRSEIGPAAMMNPACVLTEVIRFSSVAIRDSRQHDSATLAQCCRLQDRMMNVIAFAAV